MRRTLGAMTTAQSLEAAMRRALTESGVNVVTASGEFTLPAYTWVPQLISAIVYET